ncbi:TonB-dependent receptor [Lacihabitans sp. CCS-44]|uniref:TonB-dependent receptor plug domain-containing protein n=1 Tax=Lacihabitans sp. CCS-44 TaxID=2487331 RepID=UPI0020CE537C|nr:TonB-dependent receptor [Lacihabitans sp. CCS-44]MCP9756083.1 TonB-dependent receptor [Lacihabitans sp. CCS-44]
MRSLLVITFLLISSPIFGQLDTLRNLEEVIVSANKFELKKKESPNQIELISAKQIAFQNSPNTANLLEQTGNVFVQKSQAGGGSPVLRGFEASRVLIVMDGVRMNNAIFRAGHLQNVLRIDQSMLERAEVIFGPSSVIYGSDALGGVVHFRTKNPELNSKSFRSYLRYATAIGEKTSHIDFNIGKKRFAFLTSFTFSDFGNVVQGSNRSTDYPDFGKRFFYAERQGNADVSVKNENVDKQVGSAYSQYDFLQKISFQQTENIKHTVNFQYSNSSNVPRYDRLTEVRNDLPRFSEWFYGPEKRLFAAYHLDLKNTFLYDKAMVSLAFQDIKESRISRNFNNITRKSQFENVNLFSLNADFQKNIDEHTITYGFETVGNDVKSTAHFTNINTNEERKADTRYPDGKNTMNTWAVYVADQTKIGETFIAHAGLRYAFTDLSAEFIEKAFFPFPFNQIQQKNSSLTGNLGLVYTPFARTKLGLIASSGFRSPNIDDLAKVFDSVAGSLIVPNPDIKSEYSYNGEVSVHQEFSEKIRLEAVYFVTSMKNAIVIDAFTLNGENSVMYNGQNSKVLAAQNKAKALIHGWNLNLKADLSKEFTLASSLNSTKGNIKDAANTPMDHIPPLYGRTALKYQKKSVQLEVFSIYNGWKKLAEYSPSGEDNLIYATKDGMPSWWTLNLRSDYQVNKNFSVQLACENILDKNYRNFASGISSPGRNFMITVRGGI